MQKSAMENKVLCMWWFLHRTRDLPIACGTGCEGKVLAAGALVPGELDEGEIGMHCVFGRNPGKADLGVDGGKFECSEEAVPEG